MPRLIIDHDFAIPARDLRFHYARSGGPGGQNVNKVATKAELRFKLANSSALTSAQKVRLERTYPAHVTQGGDFVLTSDRFRSRQRNEEDTLNRLANMLRRVRHPPKPRVATRVPHHQKVRRVEQKRIRSAQKRMRSRPDLD